MRWKLVNDLTQFETNCDISRPEVTFNTYTTLSDLLNPTNNTYFKSGLKLNQWLALLKSIYTRENIGQNWRYFFPPLYNNIPEEAPHFLAKLFELVPEDKLWGLAFAQNHHWGSRTDRPSVVVHSGNVYGSESGCILEPLSADHISDMGIRTAGFWTAYSRSILKAARFLDSLRPQGHWQTVTESIFYKPIGIMGKLAHYALNNKIFNLVRGRNPSSNLQSPRQILAFLTANPQAKIEVVGRLTNSGFDLFCKIPPDPNDRSHLYSVFSHSANVLEHIPVDEKLLEGPVTQTLYGVELETCSNYTIRELIDAQDKLFFIGKQDGSIAGVGTLRAELVTIPMSLSDHKVAWHKLFRKLAYHNFDTSVDTSNGMHVHVSKKVFGVRSSREIHRSSHLRKFIWFISHPGHLPFILAVSERKLPSLSQWAPIPSYAGMSKGQAYKRAIELAGGLRGSVNLGSGKPTVEVRLFKGIVSVATILKNLEFVDALIEFTRTAAIREVGLSFFFKWLDKTATNKYPFLKTFVKQVKTEDMMDGAELFEAIFTEENPERIITILKDKEFPLKNTHIALINRLKGRRTLIMEEGELKLNPGRKGKLYTMDKVYEDAYCRPSN